MQNLQNTYLNASRRDLVSKVKYYNNMNDIGHVKSLTFNFSDLKNKESCLLGLSFFYFLMNKKGIVGVNSKGFFKRRLNCSLKLNKKYSILFLERFLNLNLKKNLDFRNGFNLNFSNSATFSFTIKDVYIFSELGDDIFKYRDLKNLNISITFNNNDKNINKNLLQSLGFVFKN